MKVVFGFLIALLIIALSVFGLMLLLNPEEPEPTGTGTQGNTLTCTPNTVVCASDNGWASEFGTNATRVGWGAFCNSTGSGLANDGTIFDACAPQIQATSGTSCSSLSLTRFSRGEGTNGAFVGCQGTNNVYCAESGVTYCSTSFINQNFVCSNSPSGCECGVDPGQSVTGNIVILPDNGQDSCARPRNQQTVETRYSCNGSSCVQDSNGQYTNSSCDNQCQEVQQCPSTQPRFQLVVNGQDTGLVASGSYELDSVDEVNSVVVINNEVNPPDYFEGTVSISGPNYNQSFTSGSPQSLPVAAGQYTISTSVDGNSCGSASIQINETEEPRYRCNNNYQCVEASNGEYGSLESCEDACVEITETTYDCDPDTFQCIEVEGDGEYSTLANCEEACIEEVVTFDCNTETLQCVEAGTQGQFTTLTNCEEACIEEAPFCGDGICNSTEFCERDGAGSYRVCTTANISNSTAPSGSNLAACRGLTSPTGNSQATGANQCTYCGDGVVQAGEQCDGGSSCNSSCQVILTDNAILEVNKTSSRVCSSNGGVTISYTISVRNYGAVPGTLNEIVDELDQSITDLSLIPTNISSGGVYSNGTITWTLSGSNAEFAINQTKTYTYSITLSAANISSLDSNSLTNIVSITYNDSLTDTATNVINVDCTIPIIPITSIELDSIEYVQIGILFLLLGALFYLYNPVGLLYNFTASLNPSSRRKQDLDYNKKILEKIEEENKN